MTSPLTVPPRQGFKSFIDSPLVTDLDGLEADVAVLGIPYGYAYDRDEIPNDQSNAPTAVRAWSGGFITGPDQWDFDLGGTVHDGRNVRVVDCGDVAGGPRDVAAHYANAEAAARRIFERGALLVTIGGDHGVPIPVFRALDALMVPGGSGPITLVQIDAHLDWRDEVDGVPEGYSSPIRRASEMEHIGRIVQIGLRAQGSAREGEVRDALAYGAELISAYEVHERGMAAVLERIPDGGRYYLTIDADGVDPSVMPAVMAPAPGGILFHQMHTLIHGLAAKGRVVGMDIVEITPKRDLNGITSIAAGRFIVNLIGVAARANYFA